MLKLFFRVASLCAIVTMSHTTFTTPLMAQAIDDLTIGYDLMHISMVRFRDGTTNRSASLGRHFIRMEFGKGPLTFGAVYQIARGEGLGAKDDEGLMIVGSYEHILSNTLKAKIQSRVGISPGVDYGNILYPTDTDIQGYLGYYAPDGTGFIGNHRLFPSGYGGLSVNRFGRVQAIVGAGTWWNHFNLYLTGFYSFNGVVDIRQPKPDQADKAYIYLKNRGISANLSYYLGEWIVGVRHNFPVANSGNEWVFSLQHTLYFQSH